MKKRSVIIGAGIGGIATAIRLALRGDQVTVIEANTYPGGKLSSWSAKGYRFDAGPSLFTLPERVDELFAMAGKNPKDYFQYLQLPEVCRYFWEDGTRFTVPADPTEFAREAERILHEPAAHTEAYLKDSAFKYEVLSGLFLEDSLHKISTWLSRKAFKGYLNMPKMGIFGTMDQANRKQFQQPKMVQLFNRYATYNGSDPYQTPATLTIIPHLEYNMGAYFPIQGMYGITQSLVSLASELGVEFRMEEKVTEIWVENKQAVGVKTAKNPLGERYDRVISNMDVTPTFRKLMPREKHPDRILNQPKSGSGLIFYWGIKKTFSELGLHNIFFSDDYKSEFEHQFQRKTIYADPTIYLNITSKYKPDDAPEGCENWFILLNAPANEGQDWDALIAETRKNILAKFQRILGVDIEPLIETEDVLDPRTIESRTSSAQGALYGNSSNNRFAAFLRHANFSSSIQNLYFVGGSVHPGGGIPLALSSARIAVDLMQD